MIHSCQPQPPDHKNQRSIIMTDDSVLDLDEEYPGLGEHIIEWQAA